MTQPTIQAGSIATYNGQFASTSPFGRVINTTVGAGTNRTLFACMTFAVSSGSDIPAGLVVTFGGSAGVGGTAMTLYGTYDSVGATNSCVVYKLDDPAVGAGEVFVGVGSWYGEKAAISVFVVDGLNGSSRYSAITSNRDSAVATPKNISIAATADDITIYVASALKSDMVAAAGQTSFAATAQVYNSTGVYANHSYKLGASTSVGMTWASGGTTQAADVAFVLKGTSSALAFTGTVPAQTGTVGTAIAALAMSSYYSGGTAPYAYSATGLPTGLSINTSTGSITGTPTTAGSYTTAVSVTDSAGSPATVSSAAFAWTISAPAATAITMTGPSGGQVGVASANFTVGANGSISGSHTVTPSDGGAGGTFSPTTVTISAGTPTATFTYTPSTAGARTISAADAGGYTAPATISYTASATAGTLTVSGIKNGSGTLLASTTLPNVVVIQRSNRAALLALTAQATNGAGALVISSGVLAAGVACMVLAFSDDGTAAGAWPATVV